MRGEKSEWGETAASCSGTQSTGAREGQSFPHKGYKGGAGSPTSLSENNWPPMLSGVPWGEGSPYSEITFGGQGGESDAYRVTSHPFPLEHLEQSPAGDTSENGRQHLALSEDLSTSDTT